MNKRKQQRSQIGRRSMVALLALVMLMSVCVPGFTARASMVDTDPTESTTIPVETTAPQETDPEEETTAPQVTDPEEETTVLLETVSEETTLSDETEPVVTMERGALSVEAKLEGTELLGETELEENELEADPAVALYERLMSAETYTELSDMMDAMTEEEYALMDQFTPEQSVALAALIAELEENDQEALVEYNGTLSIANTIKTDGRLTVTASGLQEGQTAVYAWEKSENGNQWTQVTRLKVTGDSYNVAEDGSWVNVALDNGARDYYRVRIVSIDGEAVTEPVYSDSEQVVYYDALQNGTFETPNNNNNFQVFYGEGDNGLYWKTTSATNKIEIIDDDTNGANNDGTYNIGDTFNHHGVLIAAEGNQAAEINADDSAALYQDVLTVPGSTMYWSLEHMGRPKTINGYFDGTDNMYVLIMPTNLAEKGGTGQSEVDTQDEVTYIMDHLDEYPGAEVHSISYSWSWKVTTTTVPNEETWWNPNDTIEVTTYEMYRGDTLIYTVDGNTVTQNETPWVEHNGTYRVPEGQYMTRYFFVAGSTGFDNSSSSGSAPAGSVGNHIDDIWFSTRVPEPNAGYANLTIKKTITGLSGDDLAKAKASLAFDVQYGSTTTQIIGKDEDWNWNGSVGSYTIRNINLGTNGGTLDYIVAETGGTIDKFNLVATSSNTSGSLKEGGTQTAEFTNAYTPATTSVTITKEVKGNMGDVNKEFPFEVTVNGGTMVNTAVAATGSSVEYSVNSNAISFSLKDGEKVVIQDVPLNATLTIKENDVKAYKVEINGTAVKQQAAADSSATSSAIPVAEGLSIAVINTNNANIDTGVSMDSMPYILLLSVAAVGAFVLLQNKRRYSGEF